MKKYPEQGIKSNAFDTIFAPFEFVQHLISFIKRHLSELSRAGNFYLPKKKSLLLLHYWSELPYLCPRKQNASHEHKCYACHLCIIIPFYLGFIPVLQHTSRSYYFDLIR